MNKLRAENVPRWQALHALMLETGSVSETARIIGVSRQAVSQAINKAKKLGVVQSTPAEERRKRVSESLALYEQSRRTALENRANGTTDKERLARYIERNESTGCWNWVGGLHPNGYGRFSYRGKSYWAHRVSWKLFRGDVPRGLELDHLCRNRACVNPDHLEAVTHRENIARSPIHPGALNRLKTHCKQGHEFTGENIYPSAKGHRRCRACAIAKMRIYDAKRRAKS